MQGRGAGESAPVVGGGGGGRTAGGGLVAPWRRLADVLEVAALLGLDGRDAEMEVRQLAGEMALAAGELPVAEHLALQLASARHAPAWRLAAALAAPHAAEPRAANGARGGGEEGTAAGKGGAPARQRVGEGSRLSLLAFAVCHCPQAQLGPLSDELLECQARLYRDRTARAAAGGQPKAGSAGAGTGGEAGVGAAGEQVLAVSAAGAPTNRDAHIAAAGAAAAAGGAGALDGVPTLGDPHLLLAGLLAAGDAAAAEELLAASLEAGAAAAAAAAAVAAPPPGPRPAEVAAAEEGLPQMAEVANRQVTPGPSFALLQRALTVGAAAQLMLAAAPHATQLAGADVPVGTSAAAAAARRRLLQSRVSELAAAVERLKAAGALGEAGGAAAGSAERCWQRLRQASDGRRLKDALPAVESARFISGGQAGCLLGGVRCSDLGSCAWADVQQLVLRGGPSRRGPVGRQQQPAPRTLPS
jgi:hypothetical protein